MTEAESGSSAGPEEQLRTLVIIPTYNERENLPLILQRLRAAVPEADVLVVDDSSPDGTGTLADKIAAEDPHVQVLHRAQKAGLGAAYVAGFRHGLAAGYDVLVEMDADGSHAPEQLPRLLAALDHADLVLGSRWVTGGQVLNWPRSRGLLSRGGNLYTRLALGIDLHDATGGYRAYRRAVLQTIDLSAIASEGYCFQVDLAWRAVQAGFRVIEVPITFAERERGESKMSGDIVREALLAGHRVGCRAPAGPAQGAGDPPLGLLPRDTAAKGSAGPENRAGRMRASDRLPPVGRTVRRSWATWCRSAAAGPQHVQSLGEHLFEVGDGAPLDQHVPVGTRSLDLLGLRFGQVDRLGGGAVQPAFPGRRQFGVVGERHAELVVALAPESNKLTRRGLRGVFGLVTDGAEAAAPENTIGHCDHSSPRLGYRVSNERTRRIIP